MEKKYTAISLFTLSFIFLLWINNVAAQDKKQKTGFEIGLDVLPFTSQIWDDNPGFRKDWEFFFKSRMEHGEFRVKFGHYNEPIHERKLFKIVNISDDCVDPYAYKNFQDPLGFHFINIGYGVKAKTKWFDIHFGSDVNLSRYKGQTVVYAKYCTHVVDGERYGGETLIKLLEKSNYLGIGVTPFIGIKVPLLKRLRLTFETGLQFNLLLGDYTYLLADRSEGYYPIRDFEINWGKLTNDVGISYTF